MTMGHVGEEFRPLSWVSEGWSSLRDRTHNALTPFRKSETKSKSTEDELANNIRWGLVTADVIEFDDSVEVRIEIPGMSREDLRVDVRDGRLAVSGEKRTEHTRNEGSATITERAFGHFFRAVPLPAGTDPKEASARYENGVLSVNLKRKKDARSHRVSVL